MFVNGSINEAQYTRIDGYCLRGKRSERKDNIQKCTL